MKEIVELCEVQIEGNITGSIEDIIEFFVDFKNSYNNMFKLIPDTEMIRRLCLAEPNDSPIKIYSEEELINEPDIWKKLDNNLRLLEIQSDSDKEKRKLVEHKLDSLLENHPLKITKLNYNSAGVMVVFGAYFVLKSIVEIIDTYLDMDKKRVGIELDEANIKLIEAKTRREEAETEKIRREMATKELVLQKDLEEEKKLKNSIDSYSNSLVVFSKYTKKGFITGAKIIQKSEKK